MPNRAKTYARYLLMVINHSLNSAFKLSYQNVDGHNKSCDLASSTKLKKVVDVGACYTAPSKNSEFNRPLLNFNTRLLSLQVTRIPKR
jgi:hypothetical protein